MRLTEFILNYAEIQIALGDEDKARQYIKYDQEQTFNQYAGYYQLGQ